jgi:hypothetical protein
MVKTTDFDKSLSIDLSNYKIKNINDDKEKLIYLN